MLSSLMPARPAVVGTGSGQEPDPGEETLNDQNHLDRCVRDVRRRPGGASFFATFRL
ncbi:hypothetical protein [Streptomyces sp. VNUA74]|uniref:hypothetical protein n=1 Tax=Streptomyces sp. VNUA74 TaxID=3062685 RepID=UPI00280BE57F|nr:hypothetical protein [Streptomyces sp. VNUA74]WML84387.1 hypothetical protein Q3101_32935 [Streptomyces sp. VNUA74]